MPRPDKVAAVDEVRSALSDSAATLLTDYRGLSVTELAELRAELRRNNATYKVVKNTLTRLAATEAGIDGLESYLAGPTALVFCEEDPVGPAKVLRAFGRDHPELLVKAGYVDGQVIDEAAALRLADLESREELLARLAGLMEGALSGFARLMQAALTDMGRVMKALEDEGGVEARGFSPSAPAAEPEHEAAPTAEPEEEPGAEAEAAPTAEVAAEPAAPEEPAAAEPESAAEAAADVVGRVAEGAADTVAGVADAAAGVADAAATRVAEGAEAVADAVTSDEEGTEEAAEAADTDEAE